MICCILLYQHACFLMHNVKAILPCMICKMCRGVSRFLMGSQVGWPHIFSLDVRVLDKHSVSEWRWRIKYEMTQSAGLNAEFNHGWFLLLILGSLQLVHPFPWSEGNNLIHPIITELPCNSLQQHEIFHLYPNPYVKQRKKRSAIGPALWGKTKQCTIRATIVILQLQTIFAFFL